MNFRVKLDQNLLENKVILVLLFFNNLSFFVKRKKLIVIYKYQNITKFVKNSSHFI